VRKGELERELNEIKKRLDVIELEQKASHPYKKIAEEFEKCLGVKPCITKSVITAKAQRDRIRLMNYLIENKHTSKNPAPYHGLVAVLSMKSMMSILDIYNK